MNPILDYLQRIREGKEIVGRWIRLQYERLERGLREGLFFYSENRARRAIDFVEQFCRHHEGRLAPRLIKLEPWQRAAVAAIFGIIDADGRRQYNEALIVTGKKQGKTLFASAIATYMTFADEEYGAEIYFTATKLPQAALCYNAYLQTIDKEPELKQLIKRRRSDVYVRTTNTTAKPIAFAEKTSDGINPHLAICDEIASWPGAKGLRFYENLQSANTAREEPLILAITTAGYEDDGIYDELFTRATRAILGEGKEEHLIAFLYIIDDAQKWNDMTELKKSLPNLGVSVSEKKIRAKIATAEGSLSAKAEFLCKYGCLKQNIATAWLAYETVAGARGKALRPEDFRECYCVGGIDLSKRLDLTAACVIIERDGRLHVLAHFWMPSERLRAAIEEDKVPYDQMIERGFLSLSGKNRVEWRDVYNWFFELVTVYHIYPLKIGYDRYTAAELVQAMTGDGYHMDDVWQGSNLTPIIQETEGQLLDGLIDIGDNSLLQSHLLNTAVKAEGGEDRRMRIVKIKKRGRIDGTAAMLDAMTMRAKYAEEIGTQLQNSR